MSIFLIMGICLAICCLVYLIAVAVLGCFDRLDILVSSIGTMTFFLIFILSIFIGIGVNTDSEKVYISKYLAEKETIEMSLESEQLSGLERVELVKKATELNGELAEKKAQYKLWHFVTYDNAMYDNIEFINFGGEK